MRTVFVGAVEGSLRGLRALCEAELAPCLVVTLPPERAARHSDFSDLSGVAMDHGCEVLLAPDINEPSVVSAIAEHAPDLALVIGWSQICRAPFRRVARLGAVGFHPAPLPRMRGRAVIPWTILTGETETGSSLFWLDDGVDSGDILLQRRFPVADLETARTLYDKHIDTLAAMLPEAVRLVASGNAPRRPQRHADATWCAKRGPEDGRIDWRAPAAETLRLIRAVGAPYPGAFTDADGAAMTVWRARPFPDGERHVAMTGQVVALTADGFAVRCGDGHCVEILEWSVADGARPRLHSKLGGARS
jgi:methionyl-tRNA formyltransferase